MTGDLSAFYFDIRKDCLYCDPPSSVARKAALTAIDILCDALVKWLAPILCFTAEEAWLAFRPQAERLGPSDAVSRGLDGVARRGAGREMADHPPRPRRGDRRAGNRTRAKEHRLVARGRSAGVSSPTPSLRAALEGVDFAEVCITSAIEIVAGEPPQGAFTLPETAGVGVVSRRAQGRKCARSWRISPLVGTDPEFPDVTPRDAQALRELRALGLWA